MSLIAVSVRPEDAATVHRARKLARDGGFPFSRLIVGLLHGYCVWSGSEPRVGLGATLLGKCDDGVIAPYDNRSGRRIEATGQEWRDLGPEPELPAEVCGYRTLTVAGLAELAGEDQAEIRKKINRLVIPSYRSAGTLLIDAAAVRDYVEAKRAAERKQWSDQGFIAPMDVERSSD